MDVSIFAFEQQVSLIRQELFKKGGLLSKPTPPERGGAAGWTGRCLGSDRLLCLSTAVGL